MCCGSGSGNMRSTLGADSDRTVGGHELDVRSVFRTSRCTGELYLEIKPLSDIHRHGGGEQRTHDAGCRKVST